MGYFGFSEGAEAAARQTCHPPGVHTTCFEPYRMRTDRHWFHQKLVQKCWDKNRGQFQSATRHLLGKPMTVEWLKTVLRDGRQRQRVAAALELAIRLSRAGRCAMSPRPAFVSNKFSAKAR